MVFRKLRAMQFLRIIPVILIFVGGVAFSQTALEKSIVEKLIMINLLKTEELFQEGYKAYGAKKYDTAIEHFNRALVINPDSVKVQYHLGLVYWEQDLSPLAAEHLYKAGMLALEHGDRDSALKAYNHLKQTNSRKLEKALSNKLYPGPQPLVLPIHPGSRQAEKYSPPTPKILDCAH